MAPPWGVDPLLNISITSTIPEIMAFPDQSKLTNHAMGLAWRWVMSPLAVCVAMLGLKFGWIPRGVHGEWTWTSPIQGLSVTEWSYAALTLAGYLTYLLICLKLLQQKKLVVPVVASLLPAAGLVQVGLQLSAPYGYGMAKWTICSYVPACSGYFTVARAEAGDLGGFLARYPGWIKSQDVLHIGTHPPGLIVEAAGWINFWQQRPTMARTVVAGLPGELREAARNVVGKEGISATDLASVVSISATHWAFCTLTVWALFLLVRRLGYDPFTAFAVAAFWPVLPSVVMFQPASDIAFAPLATLAVALACPAGGEKRAAIGVRTLICGLLLAAGMFFSLVFLAVGLIVALLIVMDCNSGWRFKITSILSVGLGFVLGTVFWAVMSHTDPILIWDANQVNHARFYVEFPRSYGKWLLADLAETGFGMGVPVFMAVVCMIIGQGTKKSWKTQAQPALITFGVLAFLAISGRSLSEVARLWVPFYPPLLTALAGPIAKYQSTPLTAWWVAWVMVQVIWLQTLLQLVYPI